MTIRLRWFPGAPSSRKDDYNVDGCHGDPRFLDPVHPRSACPPFFPDRRQIKAANYPASCYQDLRPKMFVKPPRRPACWLQTSCFRSPLCLLILLWTIQPLGIFGAEPEARIDFNRQVRPIFNHHCVACHGGVKQAGGLSFVNPADASYIVEPGDPDASYVIERVTSDDPEYRMPPPEHGPPLTQREVAVLRQWILQGGQWGQHWSFVAPQRHAPPTVSKPQWCRSPIDAFILKRLEDAGLAPNEEMAPERWLRKASLDITGLPPTPQQRAAFLASVAESGEAAYAAAVDRLLDSPAYGERWASVWLDLVRYADSKGLGQDGRRTIWKYRDWVIQALNDDLPYDEFTIKQIAGDLLPEATMDDLVATACQRLTQTNEEGGTDDEQFRVEAVIDRVNTLWQAWQGLSFGCVQCHSHPYDPIDHEEYYQFMALFNNTMDSDLNSEAPLVAVPVNRRDYDKARRLDRQLEQLQTTLWECEDALLRRESLWQPIREMTASSSNATRVVVETVDGVAEYQTRGTVAKEPTITLEFHLPEGVTTLAAVRFTGLPKDVEQAVRDSEWGFVLSHVKLELVPTKGESRELPIAWVVADEPLPLLDPQQSLNAKSSEGFGPYSRIYYPRKAAFVLEQQAEVPPGSRLRLALTQKRVELGAFPLVAHRGRVDVSSDPLWQQWLASSDRRELTDKIATLQKERKGIRSVNIPVMRERPAHLSRRSFVFDRGNFLTKAEPVEPGTPRFLPPLPSRGPVADRLDLARWLASPENPLTARVAVNRVWAQLFAIGLVETEEDFGSSGDPPSHPLLLDDLAARFQTTMGWSMKGLIREMVLSSTYRQNPRVTPEKLAADPRNRLLSRGVRHRLPAEIIRDQALAIGGILSDEQFGPPAYPPLPEGVWQPFQGGDKWETPGKDSAGRYRRTIYTYTKRTIPYPVMAAFDAPTREFCTSRRLPSNTPIQALMTLNDATFVEAAEGLARRMQQHAASLRDRLEYGFLLATCRMATTAELDRLEQLYAEVGGGTTELSSEERLRADNAIGESMARPDPQLVIVASVLLNLDEVLTR
ncbi:MAG: hypothetical protein KatS3mg111_0228 [Pirellulaceae bacterium]|nr:MAG: hypothetical protein KatS3mg111_0228 [Pirellulaceae bacterium]